MARPNVALGGQSSWPRGVVSRKRSRNMSVSNDSTTRYGSRPRDLQLRRDAFQPRGIDRVPRQRRPSRRSSGSAPVDCAPSTMALAGSRAATYAPSSGYFRSTRLHVEHRERPRAAAATTPADDERQQHDSDGRRSCGQPPDEGARGDRDQHDQHRDRRQQESRVRPAVERDVRQVGGERACHEREQGRRDPSCLAAPTGAASATSSTAVWVPLIQDR